MNAAVAFSDRNHQWPWTNETVRLPASVSDILWPKISIITPSYNQAQFLEETILSVLGQKYPSLEFIIIDGGSTDRSVDVIRKYQESITYWVSEPDKGQSDAINKGFKRATGDLITFQNSDDIYMPGAFFEAARLFLERDCPIGAIIGGFKFMDKDSNLFDQIHDAILPETGPVDLSLGPPGIYRLHQVSTIFTREALDDVGRWVRKDMQYVMDRELLYRVFKKYPIVTTPHLFGAFRQHETSKSVAEILPFAAEFAQLYLHFLSGEKSEDRKRKKMARYRRARGYMKLAISEHRINKKIGALFSAAMATPDYVFHPSFFWKWLKILTT